MIGRREGSKFGADIQAAKLSERQCPLRIIFAKEVEKAGQFFASSNDRRRAELEHRMSGEHDISLGKLFAPFLLGPSRLANRTVMAAMSRNRADVEDAADALTAKYYEQRATAG